MKCPRCSCPDTAVRDSRISERLFSVRRRRSCSVCSYRFTTYERASGCDLSVIKRSGAIKPFVRSKIRRSFAIALNKRPISTEQIELMIDTTLEEIGFDASSPVSTTLIGDSVLRQLLAKDEVAYIRYISVYMNFNGIDDFIELLAQLKISA